jgi:hypothetical protein
MREKTSVSNFYQRPEKIIHTHAHTDLLCSRGEIVCGDIIRPLSLSFCCSNNTTMVLCLQRKQIDFSLSAPHWCLFHLYISIESISTLARTLCKNTLYTFISPSHQLARTGNKIYLHSRESAREYNIKSFFSTP